MGERFHRFRLKQGLTQTQFAALLGLHRVQVSHIENAKHYPYPATVERFETLEKRIKAGKKLARQAKARD